MSCIDKLDNTCIRSYAKCMMYEGTFTDFSDFTNGDCVSIQDTTQELYGVIQKHVTALATDGFQSFCITFDTDTDGELTQREVNLGLIQTVCALKTTVDSLSGDGTFDMSKIDMDSCELNLTDLIDACGENITSFCQLIQTLVDQSISQQATIDAQAITIASQASDISTLQTNMTDALNRITVLEALHP